MTLQSPAFNAEFIPIQFTCLGENIPPPLQVADVPLHTKSFVLIFEDLDSTPIWTHWLLYNIPFSEGLLDLAASIEGLVNNNSIGYEGPCPKYFSGIHRYHFHLYALNTMLLLDTPVDRNTVEEVMQGSILGEANLYVFCSALAFENVV